MPDLDPIHLSFLRGSGQLPDGDKPVDPLQRPGNDPSLWEDVKAAGSGLWDAAQGMLSPSVGGAYGSARPGSKESSEGASQNPFAAMWEGLTAPMRAVVKEGRPATRAERLNQVRAAAGAVPMLAAMKDIPSPELRMSPAERAPRGGAMRSTIEEGAPLPNADEPIPPPPEPQKLLTAGDAVPPPPEPPAALAAPPPAAAKPKPAKPPKPAPPAPIEPQREPGKWYYDNISDSLKGWQQKGTADQLLAHLSKNKGALEEADAIGLRDWLKDKKSVSRDEVQQFLNDNKIEVNDVTKGALSPNEEARLDELDKRISNHYVYDSRHNKGFEVYPASSDDTRGTIATFNTEDEARAYVRSHSGVTYQPIPDGTNSTLPLTAVEQKEYLDLTNRQFSHTNPTKYASYQEPGGENYRELLLTKAPSQLPEEPKVTQESPYSWTIGNSTTLPGTNTTGTVYQYEGTGWAQQGVPFPNGQRGGFKANFQNRTHFFDNLDDAVAWVKEQQRPVLQNLQQNSIGGYTSPHWTEPNILAHVRMNDRTLPDGRKMLFLEELQSDWHHAGHMKGYNNPEARRAAYAAHARTMDAKDAHLDAMIEKYSLPNDTYWHMMKQELTERFTHADPAIGDQAIKDYNKAHELERAEIVAHEAARQSQFGVPDAPFKGAGWKKLAMKRMLAYAADNGYDGVGWTTGDMQNKRYGLSSEVHSIGSQPLSAGDVPVDWPADAKGRAIKIVPHRGEIMVLHVDDAGNVFRGSARSNEFVGHPLSDVVGAEMSKKLLKDGPTFVVDGEGLNIGGEGKRNLYDREIPNLTNDILKKHGVKVGKANIGAGDTSEFTISRNTSRSNPYQVRRAGVAEKTFATEEEAWAYIKREEDKAPGRDVHYVDLPAEMRSKIKRQGMPLFQAAIPAAGAAAAAATAMQSGSDSSSNDDAIRRSFMSGASMSGKMGPPQ